MASSFARDVSTFYRGLPVKPIELAGGGKKRKKRAGKKRKKRATKKRAKRRKKAAGTRKRRSTKKKSRKRGKKRATKKRPTKRARGAGGKCRRYAGVTEFGDPATCSYPVNTPTRAYNALARLHGQLAKGRITRAAAHPIERRILAAYDRMGLHPDPTTPLLTR